MTAPLPPAPAPPVPVPPAPPEDLGPADLAAFVALTFGIAWGLFGLFLAFPQPITAAFGPIGTANPLFIVAVHAPALAATGLVLRRGGPAGLLRFLRRLLLWRLPAPWLLLVFLGIPAVAFLAAALQGGLVAAPLPFATWGEAFAAMGLMAVLGPVEEFGWRGLAQPILQRHVTPLAAGLAVGLLWGFWHLPAFLIQGTPQAEWDFLPFLLGAVAVAVILTPLFNAAGGSILWAAAFHFQLNNPFWPDARPLDMVLFAAAAAAVVWLNRDAMLGRGRAATAVIPPPA